MIEFQILKRSFHQFIIVNYWVIDMNKVPTFFVFNIRRSIYENFGLTHFQHMKRYYELLPIITNHHHGIEDRAQIIVNQIKDRLTGRKDADKFHLVSYSLSGIDARYAISNLGLADQCQTLTTIGTPHRGSKGILLFDRRHFKQNTFEAIARLMGVGLKPLTEFVPSNIESFNQIVPDCSKVKYFSIGGEKLPNFCYQPLREVCLHLRQKTEPNFIYENDGIVGFDECQWGTHLVNFEEDHMELVGLRRSRNKQALANLIEECQKSATRTVLES